MSLIGSVSLSSNQQGLYLGRVNLDNLNAIPGTVLTSPDGSQIQGNSGLSYDSSGGLTVYQNGPIKISHGGSNVISNCILGNGGNSITTATNSCIVGLNNLENISTGSQNTIVGSLNGSNFQSSGGAGRNTIIGTSNNIASAGAVDAIAIGSNVRVANQSVNIGANSAFNSATQSVLLGFAAGPSLQGTQNIVIGYQSGTSLGASAIGNTIIGAASESNTNTSSTNVICIGNSSSSGVGNSSKGGISIGYNATGNAKSSSNCGIAIGYACQLGTTYQNTAAIATNFPSTTITANNQFWLGNSTQNLYSTTGVISASDRRDKANIQDCSLGLEFINKLRPRQWQMNNRVFYNEQIEDVDGKITYVQNKNDGSKTRNRFHFGVVAQEMEEIMQEMGIDFSGLQHTSVNNEGSDSYFVNYQEFIGVMLKAIQELNEKNNELVNVIKRLDSRIHVLESN
jgi:hypothetical protein